MIEQWNGGEIGLEIRKMLAKRLDAIGKGIADLARNKCSVESGELRESIIHEVDEAKLKVRVGSDDWRAHFVEMGTSHSAPEPFLRPALDEAAGIVKKAIR